MKYLVRLVLMTAMAAFISGPAYAQGGSTSSIQGVVVDTDGGVIPGATVTATNEATAGTSTAITTSNGTFTIPSLAVGTYTVTVSLQGFKTAVLKGVVATAGGPAPVRAVLEVGGLTETVTVEAASQVVQTQSAAAATTLNTTQIANLPLSTRSTLDFITFLPGVQTPGGNRDSMVNGLPQSSINITIDGVSIQDNHLKTGDGFFARVSPRIDAVEEVTVTTAGSGAESSGMGATQIRFTTRSGSNAFSGSGYHYYQSEKLNTNTYFNKVRNLPKNVALQHQPGMRAGGPVVIPGLYDGRSKMFFFVNYEENRTPRTITTNSNFLTDEARAGIFRYDTSSGQRTVNLYDLARNAGQTSTPDPLVGALLNEINQVATSGVGTITDLDGNYVARRLSFQQQAKGLTRYPTVRMDYNLSAQHRLSGSWNFNDLTSRPDTTNTQQPTFPGFPVTGAQISDRYTFQTTLRSTLNSNLVNEVRYGMSGGATLFSPDKTPEMWNGSVANQGGFNLGISAAGIANAGSAAGVSAREASTKFIENTLTWLRGEHSIMTGFNYTQADVWLLAETHVPAITFGNASGDPAANLFVSGNFPGSSGTQRTAAKNLYNVLTGRVSQIGGTARLDGATGEYVYNGDSRQEGRLREFDFFVQDNWKIRPNLSLNAGLRYVVQLPFYAKTSSYSTATLEDAWGISGLRPGCDPSAPTAATCNLFAPTLTPPGIVPSFQNLGEGVSAYETDWNNLAPSVGVNWTPSAESGLFRTLLGQQGDTSFSAGWSRSFERHGMSDFTGPLGSNPGLSINANRNTANGNLGAIPHLLRDGDLGPPAICTGAITAACMPLTPSYPIATTVTGELNIFDPNLQVPFSDTWTVAMQRAIGTKSAVEVRYVGTRNREQWTEYNYNEANIHENGFLQEYLNAQSNLYANIAAGRGEDFRYFGPGTGTVPLPIYLAYLTGRPAAQAGAAASYTGSTWNNTNFVAPLSRFAPNPFTHTGTGANNGLNGSATFRNNAVAAGLPRNFFFANPDVLGGANVTGHGGYTKYNGMQFQFRRRLTDGLQFDVNYAFGKALTSTRYSFRVDRVLLRDTGAEGDVPHAVKGTFVYELPFGQGRRYGTNAGPVLDRIIGGWSVSGTARVQSGRLLDLGNVRVVGMSLDEAEKAFNLRRVGPDEIYMWPDDIIQNTIRAYSRDLNGYTQGQPEGRYFAPANGPDCIETIAGGYGDCGVRSLVIDGPVFRTMDISFSKDVRVQGRKSIQFRIDMINAFDAVNFTPATGVGGTALSNYQLTGADSGRVVQLVTRFNW